MLKTIVAFVAAFYLGLGAWCAAVKDKAPAPKNADVLEGVLRVHPKFHYRFYLDGFGDGQECALFGADEELGRIGVSSRIRVQGDLASRFFGNPNDKHAALAQTWIIYMDVADVQLREHAATERTPSGPGRGKER